MDRDSEPRSAPRASKRFEAIPNTLIKIPDVYGSAPIYSVELLCGVRLEWMAAYSEN